MKLSYQTLSLWIKATKELQYLNATIDHSIYSNIIKKQLLLIEIYFSKKLSNPNLSRIEFFSEFVQKKENGYEMLLVEAEQLIKIREFSNHYVGEIINMAKFEFYQLPENLLNIQIKVDALYEAAIIFKEVYMHYPNPKDKYKIATVLTNSFLYKNADYGYVTFLGEIINSNHVLFTGSIINQDIWTKVYLKLIHGQTKKNNIRIKNMIAVFEKDREIFEQYDAKIFTYICENLAFTITDFKTSNEISYNTAKKYLNELVELKILEAVKFGKHNAFIYTNLYEVWIK